MTTADHRPGPPVAALPEDRRPFTSHRPWGDFEQFTLNEHSTVKLITVAPGSRLSLQRHQHRSELWQVLNGSIEAEVDGHRWLVQPGERVWVGTGAVHRLANPGAEPARVLEIGFGVFDEDDIERLEDDYHR